MPMLWMFKEGQMLIHLLVPILRTRARDPTSHCQIAAFVRTAGITLLEIVSYLNPYPYPHQGEKSDPDPHDLKSGLASDKIQNPDPYPHH
jgi:hypothetical protein